MAKNIIICSDGTGNTAIKGRGTNVFKIFESVDLNGHRYKPELTPQIAIYDDGVGTDSFKPLKLLTGATGWGLSRNVKQLYKELSRIYDPDDRIFLFGFSRGAFTVRTLAGLICACGIIDARATPDSSALEDTVDEAYRAYRKLYRTWLMERFLGKPDRDAATHFRDKHSHKGDTKIAFIGVWDTVDAVGLPFRISDFINMTVYRFKFPNTKLSEKVEHAYHALAIDDERHSFHPLLWDETDRRAGTAPVIEQVWFAGAHSNVGGGHPKQGMSLVALDWMMQKAEDAELRFVASDRQFYVDHANVDDKLYDPRAGFGSFYRWKPRDIAALCEKNNVHPAVHLSVLERIAHGTDDYTPGNLPSDAAVVITGTDDGAKNASALLRASEVQAVLKAAHGAAEPSLLERVGPAVKMGWASYYLFLLTCIVVIVASAAPAGEQPILEAWSFLKSGAHLIGGLLTSPIDTVVDIGKRLMASPTLLAWLGGGFAAAAVLGFTADRWMSAVFSQFWHKQQQELRKALKDARKIARGEKVDPRRRGEVDAGSGTRQDSAGLPGGEPLPGR